jgi:molecular chaperone HtpG
MNWYANMPDEINMTVNANHPVYTQILKEGNQELQQKQIRNLADLALLSQNLLTGADLTAFVNRSVELMGAQKQ